MQNSFLVILSFLLIFTAFLGCADEGKRIHQISSNVNTVPDVVSLDTTDIPYSVRLTKEVVFESNEEVFIEGLISNLAIDNEDRVYLTATSPGRIGIYIFEPDGSFITKFGQEGRGPGEFEAIGSIDIQGNKLYVFGPRLQKFGVFSLDDYQLIRDQVIRRDSISKNDELARTLRVNELHISESGEIFGSMSSQAARKENEITKILYHKISDDGYILPKRILELEKFRSFFSENRGFPLFMPFSRNSLVSMMNNGSFYTAWSEDFTIKKYDREGNYLQSFYFSYENAPLSISEINLNEHQRRVLREYDTPETWQALYTIETDEKNRLWVSTITESDSTFQWWVIDEKGEVLAVFNKPRRLADQLTVTFKPLYKIRNNYFYERERDVRNGIERIVKYKIEFIEY